MKVLVIQGADMELRGIENVAVFGPETLDEINADIRARADELGLGVEIFHSNDEAEVVAEIARLAAEIDAFIINPSGFTVTEGPLPDAIEALDVPSYEVHASNPSARGVVSTLLPKCTGAICGFGYAGYGMALEAIARSGR